MKRYPPREAKKYMHPVPSLTNIMFAPHPFISSSHMGCDIVDSDDYLCADGGGG